MEIDVYVFGVFIIVFEKFVDWIGEFIKIFVNLRGMFVRIISIF